MTISVVGFASNLLWKRIYHEDMLPEFFEEEINGDWVEMQYGDRGEMQAPAGGGDGQIGRIDRVRIKRNDIVDTRYSGERSSFQDNNSSVQDYLVINPV